MPSHSKPGVRSEWLSGWGRLAVVLTPVVVTYAVLWRLATAVPIIDDYPHIFAFALGFEKAPTLAAKLGLIFTTQVGPYKLIFDHALVGLQLLVFGRLNFPVLILLGNLTPLGILLVMWRNAVGGKAGDGRRVMLLLPLTLLLFSLNYAETLDWAISGLQQPAVILFSLAAIHFLVKAGGRRRDLAWACGFGVLASTTYANGMIVWPVGFVFLVLDGWREGWGRRVVGLVAWLVAFGAMLGVYLYRYQPDAASTRAAVAGKAVFFAMFCGGVLENMHHRPVPYLSLAIGLGVLGVFGHAVWNRYDRRNAFFFYSTVWVLLTGVVVANARMAMGLELSLSSRYKVYGDVLLIFCYQYMLDRVFAAGTGGRLVGTRRAVMVAAFMAAAVVFVAGDVAGGKLLMTRRGRAETAMRGYLAAPESASPMFVVEDVLSPAELLEEDKARRELNEAIALGIYAAPEKMVAEAAEAGKLEMARPEWFAAGVTGADGVMVYPPEALAGAYRATRPWGTIELSKARYVSPFWTATKGSGAGATVRYTTPRRFVGMGRPQVDDAQHPQRLVGGTILLGEMSGVAPLQMAHMGVDAGPAVVEEVYGGLKPDGIYLPNHGERNPKRGTRLEDVAVLTNDREGQHSVLLEGEDGAVVDGLWVWSPGGTHGLILKSADSVVRDYHCKGATADCLLVKSDYMTSGDGYAADDRFEEIDIEALAKAGDTGGISLDATWDRISGMEFKEVHEVGVWSGMYGAGSWFHTLKGVRVDGWRAEGVAGACADFVHSEAIVMTDVECVSGTPGQSLEGQSVVVRPERRGLKGWVGEIKPSIRIVWGTIGTFFGRIWSWVRA